MEQKPCKKLATAAVQLLDTWSWKTDQKILKNLKNSGSTEPTPSVK